MKIHGSYLDRRGRTVAVEIITGGTSSPSMGIGSPDSVLGFTAAPASTATETTDAFEHVIRQSATLRLTARAYMPELFSPSFLDASVRIVRDGETVFSGFVAPQTYSQAFVEEEDELEINCIDKLSALQYVRWRNAGGTGADFGAICAEAANVTFLEIVRECARAVGIPSVVFDGSRALPGSEDGLFGGVAVNELLFLGENEEETWTLLETLEETLRYLNLRVVQLGDRWAVFDRATLKKGMPRHWAALIGGEAFATDPKTVGVSTANAEGTDTQITVGETYNSIALTCERKSSDELVHSPLDKDSLVSPYPGPQKYLTEYYAHGEGETAFNQIVDLMNGEEPDWEDAERVDWFVRVRDNIRWRFSDSEGGDLVRTRCDGRPQHVLPDSMATGMDAALLAFGSVKTSGDRSDNSPQARLDMADALVISVNGNGMNAESEARPSDSDLLGRSPLAEYTGAFSGGVYSPADNDTTNYIVISGKLALVPLMNDSFTWADRPRCYADRYATDGSGSYRFWHRTVPSRSNGDGRYYMRRWWHCDTPFAEPQAADITGGLMPFTGEQCPQFYEFTHSAIGEAADTVSKVAVVACMLIIGDKCVVETGTGGRPSDFVWRKFRERGECSSDDEYYAQSFTVGINPKIGDFLIGQEHKVQNNIDYTMGLDTEGTAIPVRRDDGVSGKVRFIILGPVNSLWDDVTRRHPTWFRHTKWTATSVPLLTHTSSIVIRDFEVKVVSDNGLLDVQTESDLIYASDTAGGFVNKRDDITMRISSGLTAAEAAQLGMSTIPCLSTAAVTATGLPLLEVTDGTTTAKPEQMYVDAAWAEHHEPRIKLEQTLRDSAGAVSLFNRYTHPALPGRTFRVTGIDRDLTEGTARLTLKENES